MNSKFLKAAALLVIVYAFTAVSLFAEEGATPTYVGSNKCKICHKGDKNGNIWETWEGGVHANSMASLVEKGEENNPECLACHVTGYGAGGFGTEGLDEKVAANLNHVGCEACHGPGSEYKSKSVMEDREAAVAAGMIIPDEALCVTCHNEKSPTFKGFDFAEYWAKIEHKLPEPAPAEE